MPTRQPGCSHLALEIKNSDYLPSGPGSGSGTVPFRILHGGGEEGIAPTEATLNKAQNWK